MRVLPINSPPFFESSKRLSRIDVRVDAMPRNAKSIAERMQALSPEQLAEVEDFVEFIRIRGQERAIAKAASGASARVLAEIWNNPEDDVYDAL